MKNTVIARLLTLFVRRPSLTEALAHHWDEVHAEQRVAELTAQVRMLRAEASRATRTSLRLQLENEQLRRHGVQGQAVPVAVVATHLNHLVGLPANARVRSGLAQFRAELAPFLPEAEAC